LSDRILLQSNNERVVLRLNNGQFSEKLREVLPFESRSSTWGKELYFAVPIEEHQGTEATLEVSVGDVAYWPHGNSLAIFLGPTPYSDGDQPVPPDEVEIVGSVDQGISQLRKIGAGKTLTLDIVD